MKTKLIASIAGLALAGSAGAQTWGSTNNLNITLTISHTMEGTVVKDETGRPIRGEEGGPAYTNSWTIERLDRDGNPVSSVETNEYASKIGVFRYGNAQFLKELVDAQVLPQKGRAPFIAGWSLVAVWPNEEDEDPSPAYYARHRDGTMVALEGISLGTEGNTCEAAREVEVNRESTNSNGDTVSSRSYSYSSSFKGRGKGAVPGPDGAIEFTGFLAGSFKNVTKVVRTKEDGEWNVESTDVLVPGAFKFDKIAGDYSLKSGEGDDEVETAAVVEGVVTMTAGRLVDLDTFFPDI
jgi:hypothetical protein